MKLKCSVLKVFIMCSYLDMFLLFHPVIWL